MSNTLEGTLKKQNLSYPQNNITKCILKTSECPLNRKCCQQWLTKNEEFCESIYVCSNFHSFRNKYLGVFIGDNTALIKCHLTNTELFMLED